MTTMESTERGHCEASSSGYGYPRSADDVCWADTAHEDERSCPEHGGDPLPHGHKLTGPHDMGRDEREHVLAWECDYCGACWTRPPDDIEDQECPA